MTKVENGVSSNEGLCLKCARELKIKPVEDLMQKMNLTDEDLDNLTDEMMEAMSTIDGSLMPRDDQPDGEEDDGSRTATFPFLNRLFGGGQGLRQTLRAVQRGEARRRICRRTGAGPKARRPGEGQEK